VFRTIRRDEDGKPNEDIEEKNNHEIWTGERGGGKFFTLLDE
jgi:hypothetical protein